MCPLVLELCVASNDRGSLCDSQADGVGRFDFDDDRRMCTGLPALAPLFGFRYVHGADSDTRQMLQMFHALMHAGAAVIDSQIEGGVRALF